MELKISKNKPYVNPIFTLCEPHIPLTEYFTKNELLIDHCSFIIILYLCTRIIQLYND